MCSSATWAAQSSLARPNASSTFLVRWRDQHDSQQSLVSHIIGNGCGSSDGMAKGSSSTVIYIDGIYHYRDGRNFVSHLGSDCRGPQYRHLKLESRFHSPSPGSCFHLHLLVLLQWPHRPSQHLPLNENLILRGRAGKCWEGRCH